MAENSAIEWTDHTFNPWIGCTKVGPGCDHCYAADLAQARLGVSWGPGQPRRHTAASTWKQPRAWDRRAAKLRTRYRVFCASLADVFDNEVPAEWRAELFQLIRETPNLDWLFVTKRIGNAAKMAAAAGGWPSNVWLGATIVNQAEADRDLSKLRSIEGPRFRFLSMEPLLEQVLFDPCDLASLDWVIVGGESGPGARPMHPDWARSLRDQCAIAFVPFLFKQWGEWAPVCAMSEEQTDACYHPASERHPEASRRCKVNQCVLHGDGTRFDGHAMFRRPAFEQGSRAMTMMAIGKKAAGRLLDGAQHDGTPIDRANLHGIAA